ncbi:MAG: hypothetical protein BRD48_00575 [Bacteroidetes bacterium QS_9_68_14]|nr:MAG: hypothetical protein BRD48_00575 [Bacteroidetes bacterium QS_9_68_14]
MSTRRLTGSFGAALLLGAAVLAGCASGPRSKNEDESGKAAYSGGHGVILPAMNEITDWQWQKKGGSVGLNDPVIFVEPERDYPYRMYVHSASGGQDLYRSRDAASGWEKVAEDVIPSGGGTNFNWGRIGPDGRYYLYRTVNDDHTELWVGETLTEIENQGTVTQKSDTGGYYDPGTGTWHLYYEAIPAENSPCGYAIGHATSPDGVDWTDRGLVLDVRGRGGWKTGDPDVVRVGDTYHMFVDRTAPDHPRYKIAWASSGRLDDFELREEPVTDWLGGDACVRYVPEQERFVMYQEFFGEDRRGVGWGVSRRITP